MIIFYYLSWYEKNHNLLKYLKKQVQPFLIDEQELKYIDLVFKKK